MSVPLDHYLQHKDRCFGVGFHCTCGHWWVVPIEKVIAELERRKVGNAQTGIREVANFVQRPCSRCGERKITTTPAWAKGPER